MDPVCKEIKNLESSDPKFLYKATTRKLLRSGLSLCDCLQQISNENFNKVNQLIGLPSNERLINQNLKINISEVECPSYGIVPPDRQTQRLCLMVKKLFQNQHENHDLTIPLEFKIDNSRSSAMSLKFRQDSNAIYIENAILLINTTETTNLNEFIFIARHEKGHLEKLHGIEKYLTKQIQKNDSDDYDVDHHLLIKRFYRQQEKEADFLSICNDLKSTQGAISFFERELEQDNLPTDRIYFRKINIHPPIEKRLEWAKKIDRLQKTINNL